MMRQQNGLTNLTPLNHITDMTKFYLFGGILFFGSLLSIEIMNVIDAKKIEKLNAEMRKEFNEKQKKEISLMKKFCLESDASDLYLIDLETLCEGY